MDTAFGNRYVHAMLLSIRAWGGDYRKCPNLLTGHRRENFGEGFISMVTAMKDLSEKYPDGIQEEAPGLGKPVLVMHYANASTGSAPALFAVPELVERQIPMNYGNPIN